MSSVSCHLSCSVKQFPGGPGAVGPAAQSGDTGELDNTNRHVCSCLEQWVLLPSLGTQVNYTTQTDMFVLVCQVLGNT